MPDTIRPFEQSDNPLGFVAPRKMRSRRRRDHREPEKLLRCLSSLGIEHGPSTDEADELIDQLRDFVGAQQHKQQKQQAQKLQQQQQRQAGPSCPAPAVPTHQPAPEPGPSTQPLVPTLGNSLLMNALLAQLTQQAVAGACMAGAPAASVSQPAQPAPSARPAVPVASALPVQQPQQPALAGPSNAPAVSALPVQQQQQAQQAVAGPSTTQTQAQARQPESRARPVRGLMGTWIGGVAKTHKTSGSAKRKGQPHQST